MSASPLEAFIRAHRALTEDEAFARFLTTPRINAWVGHDEGRRKRLRDEFHRTWAAIEPAARPDGLVVESGEKPAANGSPDPKNGKKGLFLFRSSGKGNGAKPKMIPRAPPPKKEAPVEPPRAFAVDAAPQLEEPPAPAAPLPTLPPPVLDLEAPPRGRPVVAAPTNVMCPACGSLDLVAHAQDDIVGIRCRGCHHVYSNFLDLIPVQRVGPFGLLFGPGWEGVANFVGLVIVLVLVYGGMRWLF